MQGPWWWTTEKRSGGEGDRDPGERIQSQNKKKRWRMESKNKTKYCQLNRGERAGGSHQHTHAAHMGGPQHSLPLQGVSLGGNEVLGTTVGTPSPWMSLEAAQVWKGAVHPARSRGSGQGILTSCSCMQTLLKALSQLALARALGSCTSSSAGSLQAHTSPVTSQHSTREWGAAPTSPAGLRLRSGDPDVPSDSVAMAKPPLGTRKDLKRQQVPLQRGSTISAEHWGEARSFPILRRLCPGHPSDAQETVGDKST